MKHYSHNSQGSVTFPTSGFCFTFSNSEQSPVLELRKATPPLTKSSSRHAPPSSVEQENNHIPQLRAKLTGGHKTLYTHYSNKPHLVKCCHRTQQLSVRATQVVCQGGSSWFYVHLFWIMVCVARPAIYFCHCTTLLLSRVLLSCVQYSLLCQYLVPPSHDHLHVPSHPHTHTQPQPQSIKLRWLATHVPASGKCPQLKFAFP